MQFYRDLIALTLLSCTVAAVSAQDAASAKWPNRPIKIIVPYAAGGGTDIVARQLSARLSQQLGQTIVVDNRAGAATLIGTAAVAQSDPDGYTFLFTSSAYSVNFSLMPKLPYDTSSFVPVGQVALHPFVLVTHPSLGVASTRDLISLAKSRPSVLSYASVGNGSTQHIEMEMLKRLAGIDIVHVPYKINGQAVSDVMGGQVSMMLNGISTTLEHIKSGRLSPVAVDSDKRVDLLPNVPTFLESGLPRLGLVTWSGLLAPARTPTNVIEKMSAHVKSIVDSVEFHDKLAAMGLVASSMPTSEFSQFIEQDIQGWRSAVKTTGATID